MIETVYNVDALIFQQFRIYSNSLLHREVFNLSVLCYHTFSSNMTLGERK